VISCFWLYHSIEKLFTNSEGLALSGEAATLGATERYKRGKVFTTRGTERIYSPHKAQNAFIHHARHGTHLFTTQGTERIYSPREALRHRVLIRVFGCVCGKKDTTKTNLCAKDAHSHLHRHWKQTAKLPSPACGRGVGGEGLSLIHHTRHWDTEFW